MIKLSVNGEVRELEDGLTVSGALDWLGFEGEGFAVAVNGEFVPRATYPEHRLQDGDQLDVVAPMQGG